MKKIVSIAAAAAVLFSTTNSFAESAPYELGNTAGFFVSGNLGYGKVDIKNSAVAARDMRGFTWNMNGGYQFCRFAAAEIGYTKFHDAANTETSGWNLIAKGIYPLRDQFDIFGKVGLMRLSFKDTAGARRDKVTPQFGLGGSYNINANIALSVQGLTTLAGENNLPATYAAYAGACYKFTT